MRNLIFIALMLLSVKAAANITDIEVTHAESTTAMDAFINAETPHEMINQLINYFKALRAGSRNASLDVQVGQGALAAADGTASFHSDASSGDTITVHDVTLTAVNYASEPSSVQFRRGSTIALTTAAFCAAVNGTTTLAAGLTAAVNSSSASICTITADSKGTMGNLFALAESTYGARIVVSGASVFTGGVNRTDNAFSFGY